MITKNNFVQTNITYRDIESLVRPVLLEEFNKEFKDIKINADGGNFDDYYERQEAIVDEMVKDIFDKKCFSNAPIVAAIKYDLHHEGLLASDSLDYCIHEAELIEKISELIGEDNEFIELTKTNKSAFRFMVRCIADPDIDTILRYICRVYECYDPKLIGDMFCMMAVVLDETAFATVLCELYIYHLYYPHTENTYYSKAIYNCYFKKESIEKIFWNILFITSIGIITERNKELVGRMIKAITYFNNNRCYSMEEYWTIVEDLFDVDEYIEKVAPWTKEGYNHYNFEVSSL